MSVQEQEQVVWLSVSTPSITLALALALDQAQALVLDQTRATAAVATLAPMSGTPSQDHRSSRKSSSHVIVLQHCTFSHRTVIVWVVPPGLHAIILHKHNGENGLHCMPLHA